MNDQPNGTDTIVFIHGLYLAARSWELWAKRDTNRGEILRLCLHEYVHRRGGGSGL